MDQKLIESLKKMEPQGNILKLPVQQLSNYAAVKKCLIDAGGKYVRGGMFQFDGSAEEVVNRLIGGEAINDKKKFQFFPTPLEIVQMMVAHAAVPEGGVVLEPSAGQGNIIDVLIDEDESVQVVAVELMPQCVKALDRKGYAPIEADFLTLTPEDLGRFDAVIMNPPFSNGQDIDHIRHAFQFLKEDGKLVAISCPSWEFREQKKFREFKGWLNSKGAHIYELPEGSFKQSGTNVRTVMIYLEKSMIEERPRRPLSLSSES